MAPTIELRTGLPYYHLKHTFADPRDVPERALRIRSEFFSHSMAPCTLASLLTQLGEPRTTGRRQITFTAMGGAYNRVAEDATASTSSPPGDSRFPATGPGPAMGSVG